MGMYEYAKGKKASKQKAVPSEPPMVQGVPVASAGMPVKGKPKPPGKK